MKWWIIAPVLFLLSLRAFAQPPDTLWTKTFGGAGEDTPAAIQTTGDGGYIIVGITTSFGAGESDMYVLKIANDGQLEWQRTFGGPGADAGTGILTTRDGFLFVGYADLITWPINNVYAVRTDTTGDTLWTACASHNWAGDLYRVVAARNGNGFVLWANGGGVAGPCPYGYVISDSGLVTDSWFGHISYTSCRFGDCVSLADGGHVIATYGRQWIFYDPYHPEYGHWEYLTELGNNMGTLRRWTIPVEYSASIDPYGLVALRPNGNILLLFPGLEMTSISASGDVLSRRSAFGSVISIATAFDSGYVALVDSADDILLKGYNEGGWLCWTKCFGGSGSDHGIAMQATPDGGYIIAGTTTSFGAGSTDIFVIKTSTDHPLALDPKPSRIPADYSLSAYPNPFNPTTTISFSMPRPARAKVEVFDVLGRLVAVPLPEAAVSIGEHQITFDGSALSSGIYFVRLQGGSSMQTRKMVLLK